jgi:hypothetical protein
MCLYAGKISGGRPGNNAASTMPWIMPRLRLGIVSRGDEQSC